MNICGYYQQQQRSANAAMGAACEVVCPKPRRRVSCHLSRDSPDDISGSNAGSELLQSIFTKGNNGVGKPNLGVSVSPPFFSGSPPSRTSNPVTQDAQFVINKAAPSPTVAVAMASPSSSARCVRTKFGHKPAAVRIEGFKCLGRDRRNCRITALA